MNRRHRASSSSLFLMELILAILFFCIASTICISIFVKAHTLNKNAAEINRAIHITSDTAEIISSGNSYQEIIRLLQEEYPSLEQQDETFYVSLDEQMNPTNEGDSYIYTITFTKDQHLLQSDLYITTSETAEDVYSLSVQHAVTENMR